MRKAISLALAMMFLLTMCAWAQSNNNAPKILMISRVTLKEGKIMQYQNLDRQVRQVVHKADPNLNWITATAFTGADNEETYFQFLNSYAQVEQADIAFGKAAGTLFMSAEFNQNVAETAESGRNIICRLNEDQSFNPDKFDPANAKFWSLHYVRFKPGSLPQLESLRKEINAELKAANYDDSWLTYQVSYGMPSPALVVVRSLKSLASLDTDLSNAYNSAVTKTLRDQFTSYVRDNALYVENVIYQVKPDLSHPPQSLVAANPDFWTVKEMEQAPAVAKNKKTKKQAVEPAGLKEKANQ